MFGMESKEAPLSRAASSSCHPSSHSPIPRASKSAQVGSLAATGAGLLPIAVGYLIAHYLTYLLIGPAWVLVKLYRKLGWSY